MCDSTNALRPGFTMSEKTVGATFEKIFNDNKNSRIIATFASNVDRGSRLLIQRLSMEEKSASKDEAWLISSRLQKTLII